MKTKKVVFLTDKISKEKIVKEMEKTKFSELLVATTKETRYL